MSYLNNAHITKKINCFFVYPILENKTIHLVSTNHIKTSCTIFLDPSSKFLTFEPKHPKNAKSTTPENQLKFIQKLEKIILNIFPA